MPYSSGVQGADPNCAKVFMEGPLHTALLTSFVYVEQRTSAAITARVYKSPAIANGFATDWFLIVRRSTDFDTLVSLGVTEVYNAATHLCFNYAPSGASLVPTVQFAVNDATGKDATSSTLWTTTAIGVSTAGFAWWLSVTANRVVLGSRVTTTDYGVYAGLYEDLQSPSISPFPLLTSQLMASTSAGSATREPGQTGSHASNFRVQMASSWTPVPNPEGYTAKAWLSRKAVVGRVNTYYRGLLRDVWHSPVQGMNGDTLNASINAVPRTLVQIGTTSTGIALFVDAEL